MPDEKPLNLDSDEEDEQRRRKRRLPRDDDDEPPRPRRRRDEDDLTPAQAAANSFAIAKWILLGIGGMLITIALNQAAPWAAALAGVACFAGIASRIAQAEEHHHRGKN